MTDKARDLLRTGGIMTLSILIMAIVIALVTKLTESIRVGKLHDSVEELLGQSVGEQAAIDGTLDGSAVAFALDSGDVAVVMRVETIYGPMPCVYVAGAMDDEASFAGTLAASGRVANLLMEREHTGSQQSIDYWARRIPAMIPYVESTLEPTEGNGA